jgi:hypothetical protein
MVSICLQLLFLLPLALCDNDVKCEPGEMGECSKCYIELAGQVTKQDRNLFNIQNTFYPTDGQPPVFVTVLYVYKDSDDELKDGIYAGDEEDSNNTEVWFWSKSAFYLFQPLYVFQFTSLFFSDTELQWAALNLTLPTDCANASYPHMKLLTQRVSP